MYTEIMPVDANKTLLLIKTATGYRVLGLMSGIHLSRIPGEMTGKLRIDSFLFRNVPRLLSKLEELSVDRYSFHFRLIFRDGLKEYAMAIDLIGCRPLEESLTLAALESVTDSVSFHVSKIEEVPLDVVESTTT